MKSKPDVKVRAKVLTVFISIVVVGLISILLFNSTARSFGLHMLALGVLALLSATLSAISLATQRHNLNRPRKILLGIGIGLCLIATVGSIYISWPRAPWGRAGALRTADEFMSDLKASNYTAATEKLTPVTQKSISANALTGQNARPITWQLTGIDQHSAVTGKAVFSDGTELPVTIRMRWLSGRWQIYGVTFGTRFDDIRIDFMACCDSWW